MPNSINKAPKHIAWLPDLLYTNGRFEQGVALLCNQAGNIINLEREPGNQFHLTRLKGQAMLPGMVNAHSHAFQRVIRGRTERRTTSAHDSFWTWREMMYSAAVRLTPEDIYDASRMAFLEMALGGITAVGEFHYIHHAPDGEPYEDPNQMAEAVIRAARDVGLRIALLRVAYARSGFGVEQNERQRRFIEADPETYLRNIDSLREELARSVSGNPKVAWAGVAPHSVRAVPLDYLREVAKYAGRKVDVPLHMHVAEQPAEIRACLEEYNRTPVQLLESDGILAQNFTAVHAVHITVDEARILAKASAQVCACPTTERNLGDGIVPADMLFAEGVPVSLGTDSHAQIDLLEDARELEYHLRLRTLERAVLAPTDNQLSSLAARLFDCATVNGARSINAPGGQLLKGFPADFFTVDLNDPSIAGASADDLLSHIVFGLARTAIKDVFVGGHQIVSDRQHEAQPEIVERFKALQKRLWGSEEK
jgi:formimidoylglutamate deiminase